MFDCPYCHAPLVTYSALLNHKRDAHPAEPWPQKLQQGDPELIDGPEEKS